MINKKVIVAASIISLAACVEKVPITGRRQVSLVAESDLVSMSLSEYDKFLLEHKPLPATDARAQLVKKVGEKIQAAVVKFMSDKGLSQRIDGYQWAFNTVDDATVNAWCMPGGKVVVYTGLLPITQDEASLAVVMGHEIAHAIARHGNERMSQGMAVQFGGLLLSAALQSKPQETQNLFMQSYGLGSTLGVLKYSRTHESEADKMGLVFSAIAGYDPNAAVAFWERMAAQGGQKPLEILSTHPSDDTRIADIKAFLPEALTYYKK
jgi:predicted Zn-dependent protease